MPYRQASTRAERQIVADTAVLLQVLVDDEDLRGRRSRRITHRQTADLPGRRQVPFGQHRRHRQDIRDVVEPVAGVVGRQQRLAVDLESEEITDGVGVLGPVQPVDSRTPSRVRVGHGDRIERPLEPGGDTFVLGVVRTRPAGWRHRPCPQLADHVLPELDLGTVLANLIEIQLLQRQPGGQRPVVVTGDTVAVEEKPVVVGGRLRLGGCLRLRGWLRLGGR